MWKTIIVAALLISGSALAQEPPKPDLSNVPTASPRVLHNSLLTAESARQPSGEDYATAAMQSLNDAQRDAAVRERAYVADRARLVAAIRRVVDLQEKLIAVCKDADPVKHKTECSPEQAPKSDGTAP